MNYCKKILVLKQTEAGFCSNLKEVSGIVRLEEENGVISMQLSLINVKGISQGEYRLFIVDGKGKLYSFPLENKPQTFCTVIDELADFSNGFSSGLVYVSEEIPLLVAFGKTDGFFCDIIELRKLVAEKCLLEKKEREKEAEKELEKTTEQKVENSTPDLTVTTDTPVIYNDEAVATENYYELEKDDEPLYPKTDLQHSTSKEETEEKPEFDFAFQDEKDADFSQEMPYYSTAKKELDDLFSKFPPDDSLLRYFPDSKWVKINYSPEKYYLVGLVNENDTPKYICYGVPDKYSDKAPNALDGFCSFIPLSLFDLKGDGYWMIFQDAITGNCIKKQ